MRALPLAAAALFAVEAQAGVVSNDRGTHTVNGPSPDLTVSNATTRNVVTGRAGLFPAPTTIALAPEVRNGRTSDEAVPGSHSDPPPPGGCGFIA
jgi:hypothetical protein